MTDLAQVDYFTDADVAQDPYDYWDYLREQGPVFREPHYGVVAVTGYQEVQAAFKDVESFSAVNAIGGPFPPLPFTPEGDDISELIEAHRHEFPIFEHMVVMDPPEHDKARSLLGRLLTPRRLQENKDYIWQLADRQFDEFIANGHCEFLSEYAKPFATLAIADLLGVPDEDRPQIRRNLGAGNAPGARVGALDHEPVGSNPLQYLDDLFSGYIADRRERPRDDVLTGLATATYPDGSTPPLLEVVRPATFLFAAGQETVTKLLSAAVQVLGDQPELQARLRADRGLIGPFIEEALRMQSPTKVDFRLARKTTTLGGVHIPAGTVIMLCLGAANRDPRKFENPNEFRIDRKNVREHIAFGRGIHTCAGAPLARVEGQITINRLLDRTSELRINEAKHGPASSRQYRYESTFLLRGLTELHIEFTQAG
ncbi:MULTISPECIES: cytochrome P450 [Mycobacterium avium complex (MAC)]|uniref:Cytochrome P450 n=1 Tax=Mycobacterium avium subsp. hominissuis TaxID=439334 RepID=A0AAI8X1C0_MYCAV|nr:MULTISPECIES: cytochrome P450 [Mycobacterium avium complex (MAC)]ETB27155.1 cytochrome P450 [Mycobacterium avium subsp. hominissuis 10-4249]ETB50513.1 cytochrome P450 [Mycobacterium avium 10-5560]APT09725.1 cytochrome [Mycobacterium avium subsp. hominissuis]ETZ65403.1 cytochrome P450 family protein [Mycobacterium sp. MAC_080597_8934]ETZ72394.1 cytochrome P450 family protein [Mycobacterium sp. MAC_011194_8550]